MTAAEHRIARLTGRVPQRIAIVRALYLGDLLLAVPALRALRTGFPRAEITLIGLDWAAAFAERFSAYVDRFVPFPGFPGIDEVVVDPVRTATFLRAQQAYGYDLIIQMHGSGRTSNPFVLGLGGSLTAGFYDPSTVSSRCKERSLVEPRGQRAEIPPCVGITGGDGLDIAAPYPDDLHEIERNLRLVAMLGCPADDASLAFPVGIDDRDEADALLARRDHRPPVGIHPGAKHPSRRWPAERFAAVADGLAARYGARIVITGGADEIDVARAVERAMRFPATVLAGKTSIGGLAALIERLDLYIANDTGPAHIAGALGTPAIVLFGPADLRRWAPRGPRTRVIARDVACRPCGLAVCPIDHRCLAWIKPEEVVAAASELLSVSVVPEIRVLDLSVTGNGK